MNTILIKIDSVLILFQGTEKPEELYFKARKKFCVSDDTITRWQEIFFQNDSCIIPASFLEISE